MSAFAVAKRVREIARTPASVAIAAFWLLLCLSLVVLSPVLPIPDQSAIDLMARLQPPIGWGGSLAHPLGTDDLGRDMLARLISSLRVSLVLALGATIVSALHWYQPRNCRGAFRRLVRPGRGRARSMRRPRFRSSS